MESKEDREGTEDKEGMESRESTGLSLKSLKYPCYP